MVKTSSTPGKTQALNFFIFEDEIAFADLPGYGYAQVPQAYKKAMGSHGADLFGKTGDLKADFISDGYPADSQ